MAQAEFNGNVSHTLDSKGRATIPSAYRDDLGEEFTVGLNSNFTAIAIYPKEKWQNIGERLDRIPDTDARGMAYVRLIRAFSFPNQRLDAQGRVLLPQALRKKTGMDKEISFVGVGRYLEIWDAASFEQFTLDAERDAQMLLEHVNETT